MLTACGGQQPTAIATDQAALPIVLESPIPSETPTESPTATVTPSPTPFLPVTDEGRLASAHIESLLPAVDGERLYDTAFDLANINSRNVNSSTIAEAAEYIHAEFAAAGGNLQVSFDEFPLTWNGIETTQRNVIATLPGSDPDAGIIVIGAHYDSRTIDLMDVNTPAPGANDNASGTSVVIELARVMADETPRATIVFIAFSAEEVGKIGSIHYAQQALQRGDDIRAMICLDTVGNAIGPEGEGMMRVFSADPAEGVHRRLAAYTQWQAEYRFLPNVDVQVQQTVDRPNRYSDHVPFSDAGFPAVRFIETLENLGTNHSSLDRPEKISPRYMQMIAQMTLISVTNLAYAPDVPEAAPVLADGVLTWQPVDGAIGYVVALWQPDAPDLHHTVIIREADASAVWAQISEGKGDFPYNAISIAAVDADGHMSLFSPELRLQP